MIGSLWSRKPSYVTANLHCRFVEEALMREKQLWIRPLVWPGGNEKKAWHRWSKSPCTMLEWWFSPTSCQNMPILYPQRVMRQNQYKVIWNRIYALLPTVSKIKLKDTYSPYRAVYLYLTSSTFDDCCYGTRCEYSNYKHLLSYIIFSNMKEFGVSHSGKSKWLIVIVKSESI